MGAIRPATCELGGRVPAECARSESGPSRKVFAKVLRPVEGIAEPGYGDFDLQRDLEADIEKKLEQGEAHTLHVAALDDRTLRFLGPETVYGKQTIVQRREDELTGSCWRALRVQPTRRWQPVLGVNQATVSKLGPKRPYAWWTGGGSIDGEAGRRGGSSSQGRKAWQR